MAGTIAVGICFRPFESVKAGIRLHADAANLRVQFLQADASCRRTVPLVPRPATKCVICPRGLLPDFRSSGRIVRGGIGEIGVLIGIKVLVGFSFVDFADTANGAVGAFVTRGEDYFDAVHLQDLLALCRGA